MGQNSSKTALTLFLLCLLPVPAQAGVFDFVSDLIGDVQNFVELKLDPPPKIRPEPSTPAELAKEKVTHLARTTLKSEEGLEIDYLTEPEGQCTARSKNHFYCRLFISAFAPKKDAISRREAVVCLVETNTLNWDGAGYRCVLKNSPNAVTLKTTKLISDVTSDPVQISSNSAGSAKP